MVLFLFVELSIIINKNIRIITRVQKKSNGRVVNLLIRGEAQFSPWDTKTVTTLFP